MWVLFPIIALVLVVVLAVGVLAAVVAAAAVVVGLVLHAVPFLLIGLAVWWLAKVMTGGGHHRRYREPVHAAPRPGQTWHQDARPSARPTTRTRPAATRAAPRRPRDLPIDVQLKVEQIRHKADVLSSYADRFPPFSQDLYIVRQTTADYLPRTVNTYLAVPKSDDPLLGAPDAAALAELQSQLTLLDTKLDEIAQNLQRHDLDELLANRRFLEERFGPRDQSAEATPPSSKTGAA